MRRPLALLAGLTAVAAALLLAFVLWIRAGVTDSEYTLATLDCGPGRQIVLSTWALHEGQADLTYRVFAGGREVVPATPTDAQDEYFWEGRVAGFDGLHFSTLTSADGRLVGVVAAEFPYSLIVVHDFSTGESSPGRPHDVTSLDEQRRRQALRERLEADHPQAARAGKAADPAYLAGRTDLNLSYSQAGDADLARLAGCPRLKTLRLQGTAVSDQGLEHLAALPGLRALFLSRTAISDDGMAALAAMPALEQVNLTETAVTDRGLGRLPPARKLRDIDLTHSRVTPEGVARLRQAMPHAHVWWED